MNLLSQLTQTSLTAITPTRIADAGRSVHIDNTGLVAQTRTTDSNQLVLNTVKNKSQRFAQFAQLGQHQQQVSRLQESEQGQTHVYRVLIAIEKQLDKGGANIEQLGLSVKHSARQSQHILTNNLQPVALSKQGAVNSYQLQGIDLLTPKSSETITLLLPGARQTVAFTLPEFGNLNQSLHAINKGLAGTGMSASTSQQKQLLFSVKQADEKRFEQAAQISGEGVRIPAGNPVPVKFSKLPGKLEQLSDILIQGETRMARRQIIEAQQLIKKSIAVTRKAISQLTPESTPTNPLPQSIKDNLSQTLANGDFGERLTAIIAQANMSRDNTVALLKN